MSREELEQAYNKFQNGDYEFGMYKSEEDIKNACLNGKIFILKGKIGNKFLIMGPKGVIHKGLGHPRYFSWSAVERIEAMEAMINYLRDMYIKCHLINGETENFSTRIYKRKEFPKKKYRKLFSALFHIYWELGRS